MARGGSWFRARASPAWLHVQDTRGPNAGLSLRLGWRASGWRVRTCCGGYLGPGEKVRASCCPQPTLLPPGARACAPVDFTLAAPMYARVRVRASTSTVPRAARRLLCCFLSINRPDRCSSLNWFALRFRLPLRVRALVARVFPVWIAWHACVRCVPVLATRASLGFSPLCMHELTLHG
jgi:hypothetical protein